MAVAMPSKHLLFERVPTRVSCDVTSENLRNVYNKEYIQPLLAICNQSCMILSISGIVLSSSSFLWASEGNNIFLVYWGRFSSFFFCGELIGIFCQENFFMEPIRMLCCLIVWEFWTKKSWRCNFCALVFHSRICAWEFQILDRKNGNKKNGQMLFSKQNKKEKNNPNIYIWIINPK